MRHMANMSARGVLPAAFLFSLAACQPVGNSFLDPAGPVAQSQNAHFRFVIALTLIVVVPVIVATPLVAWHYRRSNARAAYRPRWDYSLALEVVVWGVPVLIVAVLAWRLWIATHALEPGDPLSSSNPSTPVQVVGYDWKWLFIYPEEGIASVGELVFPQDRPVALELTTEANIQSFMIPALAGQVYAIPGRVTSLNFAADAPGDFAGQNAQYNGRGFNEQKFIARAVPPDEYAAFVATARSSGTPFDEKARAALAARSTKKELAVALGVDAPLRPLSPSRGRGGTPVAVITFRGVPPDAFASAVARVAAPPATAARATPAGGAPDRSSPAAAATAASTAQGGR